MCIEKSLLLFRFAPCGRSCQGGEPSKAPEGSVSPLLRSKSVSEGDFQPSTSLGPQPGLPDDARQGQSQPNPENHRGGHGELSEGLPSQPKEPASPSTFPRKAPFSRSRLRLLSCRSLEDSNIVPSVKERYPILKHILNFMKDQALTTAR